MDVSTQLVTVAEYASMPAPKGGHYELHHGEVVFVTAPKWGHQRIQDRLQLLLRSALGDGAYVTKEMAFKPAAEYEVWEADVGMVTVERANNVMDDAWLEGAPDLVIEVLSPSNTVDEINDKLAVCVENGCRSFWIVDPKRKRVSVTEGDTTRHFNKDQSIHSSVFELSAPPIPVSSIFADSK